MQLKKLGKIRLDLFQKVEFDPESAETMLLVLLCAAAFGISFFSSGKILFDYRLGAKQSAPGSKSDGIIAEKVLAAESQKSEDAEVSKNNYFAEEMKVSNTMSGAADSVKSLAIRTARAKKISRARAAASQYIRVDGKRVCEKKNDKPHESKKNDKPHMDMECCPDPDEWPNPHCYYTPEQLSRMLKLR
ncbi:MAG: hypothetical protein UW19_C0005G0047 [Candidatus Moranbacteria bacterium GW2011_GWF2_44_10]|nr:MAG: hypothetical protein UW19_C0005G0047 [Candidatus Moranbacteria bacterium GW2011_GWF2_44_10]